MATTKRPKLKLENIQQMNMLLQDAEVVTGADVDELKIDRRLELLIDHCYELEEQKRQRPDEFRTGI